MKTRIILLFLLAAFTASAQENVAGGWAFVNIKQNLPKGFALNLKGEYRCKDNFRANDEYVIRFMGDWKACDYFKMSLGYDYQGVWKNSQLKNSHRGILDLKGMYEIKGWHFSLRERYVFSYTPSSDSYGHVLRTEPVIAYSIPNSIFTPYIEAELYNALDKNFELRKVHFYLGTEIKANAYNTFKIFYVLQDNISDNKLIHTVGVEYDITLPWK